MSVLDGFQPVSTWSVDEVRAFLESGGREEYSLVDVRQPREYEAGHLPSARLIPLGELPDRCAELDRERTTVVYCAAGVRSLSGAAILARAGFRKVVSMSGGIHAWQGAVASGFPESGMKWFASAASAGELVALAWVLEAGAKEFYSRMAQSIADRRAASLFADLVADEASHEAMLSSLYQKFTGGPADAAFSAMVRERAGERLMEGGIRVDEALAWSDGRSAAEITELALSMEAISYDRYHAMAERAGDEASRKLFALLAAEERSHLTNLTSMFESALQTADHVP